MNGAKTTTGAETKEPSTTKSFQQFSFITIPESTARSRNRSCFRAATDTVTGVLCPGQTKRGLHRMKNDEIPSPKIQSTLLTPPRSNDASHICSQEHLCRHQLARKRFPGTEFLENRRLLRLCSSICGREQHQLHGDPGSACVHLHHIHQRGRLPAILRGSPERDPQQHERHDPYPDSLRTLQDPAGQRRDNCFLLPLARGLHREWYLHHIPQLSRPERHGLRVVQPRIPSLGLWDSPGSYLRS